MIESEQKPKMKKSNDRHYCDKCDKDYVSTVGEVNLEGLDSIQRLIAKDKVPKRNLGCPDCGTFGYPYFVLNQKTNIFENVSNSTMIGWLLISYYINGKWIHPLLIYIFDIHDFQSDLVTWIFVSPFFTMGLFAIIAKLTEKKTFDFGKLPGKKASDFD